MVVCSLLASAVMAEAFAFQAPKIDPRELRPGGETTLQAPAGKKSFREVAPNVPFDERMAFHLGSSIFDKLWVSSPSSTTASDGLGPLYNARSCQRCHQHNGRGKPPEAGSEGQSGKALSLLLRLSIPAQSAAEQARLDQGMQGVIPEPVYGDQLQDFAVPGLLPEGQVVVNYQPLEVRFPDGEVVTLRQPTYQITALNYGAMHPETQISPRVAPAMIGMGLLEAIADSAIVAQADPDDRDGNGISGRVNTVWDAQQQTRRIGRFGWKAGVPTLHQQNSAAFAGDVGISTPLFPVGSGACTAAQTRCLALPDGNSAHMDNVEASAEMVTMVDFYTAHLAVPARRGAQRPDVIRGRQWFYESGCQQCHTPRQETTAHAPVALRNQVFWPYTDLLLHDMGEGLADGRAEFDATGREWRTPPLWGIGLLPRVNGHQFLLHDGRARGVQEAILWHGGEASRARGAFMELTRQQRAELIAFVESL